MSDPDAARHVLHWLLYNLPPTDGRLPAGGATTPDGKQADNSGGRPGWYAPCPPSGTHHYEFTTYALNRAVTGRSMQNVLDDVGRAALARDILTALISAG